ncbi:enoyl-CoA hydratase/isomerase family protein [Sphingobacterium sp. DN00404]|uniref:Enoyl-CoA hydratase/isomerase family protein n=1 Tax=Sphingobacterium micropteri TaxID=2763501 RepID=A0ABR7YKP7_9SPHI|nr:enoyl-CoA hydratase-related protein [Sphingobacterium micropteri]MBD1431885.1 enoyl-CoA hydratase/isomerase family protein [Sphingobacterium micropteri]
MQETPTYFLLEIKHKTAYITVNRPDKLNALNTLVLAELAKILATLKEDEDVHGIILTGAGDKAFVAGADIKEFQEFSADEAWQLSKSGQEEVMDELYTFPKPVIAAINGFALGGGLELAMACHIRVASELAKMGLPEVSLGIIPGYGGTQRLPQLVGRGKALEMIMTGEMIDAADARQWGLVNYVVSPGELISTCEKLLEKMYQRSQTAIAEAIRVVNIGLMEPEKGYEEEMDAFAAAFDTPDFKEGVTAFLEKRKPNF